MSAVPLGRSEPAELFTTRAGGVSAGAYRSANLALHVGDDPAAVAENRRRLESRLGVPVVFAEQVHGCRAVLLQEPPPGPVPQADALVTTSPGLALAVLVADCLPVLWRDRRAGVVAATHAGRAGLLAGVLAATLSALQAAGASPQGLEVSIGPHIGPCCYELPDELCEELARDCPRARSRTRWGTPALDLAAAAWWQLERLGVTRVRVDPRCTRETAELFSYRREGVTGRFAGVVWR